MPASLAQESESVMNKSLYCALSDIFPTLIEAAGLPRPTQRLHGSSLIPLLHDPTRVAFKKNASFSQYPRSVDGVQYMGMSMRTADWRLTEWCAFDYEKAYPKFGDSPFDCQLELYPHVGDDGKDMDKFENENVAYQASNKGLVEALHKELVLKWDNGLGPPPPISHPPTPPASPPSPVAPPGPRVEWRHDGVCLTAIDQHQTLADGVPVSSAECLNPQCDGLAMGPCGANGTVWQEIHTGVEPIQIENVVGPGGCLNLYGGGERNCPEGTGIHRTSCGRRYGNRFAWVPTQGQLAFGERSEAEGHGNGAACSGLCAAVSAGGCVVVELCTSEATHGWQRIILEYATR